VVRKDNKRKRDDVDDDEDDDLRSGRLVQDRGSPNADSNQSDGAANKRYELYAQHNIAAIQLAHYGDGPEVEVGGSIKGLSDEKLMEKYTEVADAVSNCGGVYVSFTNTEKNEILGVYDAVFGAAGSPTDPQEVRSVVMRTVLLVKNQRVAYNGLSSKSLARWINNRHRLHGRRGPRVVEEFELAVMGELLLCVFDKDEVCEIRQALRTKD
jgi:hypothetical protein